MDQSSDPGSDVVGSSFGPRARSKRQGLVLTGGLGVGEGLHGVLIHLHSFLTQPLPMSGAAVRIPLRPSRPQSEIARLQFLVW